MENDDFDGYELVGMNADDKLPPRAELASFEPKGLGTPYRESLFSYFLRLADVHHVSPQNLARYLILPLFSSYDQHENFEQIFILESKYFNGMNTIPEQLVKAIGQLTGRNGLEDLTLLPLRQFISNYQLLAKKKKWCPICLFETSDSRGAYDQLIWGINAINSCPKHQVRLVSHCECGDIPSIPFLNMKHLPGVCKYCGGSLSHNNVSSLEPASKEENDRSQMVAELLEHTASLKHKSENIAVFLRGAVSHFAQGEASLFAHILGVRKNTFHCWVHGQCTPNFGQILNIASMCRCPISHVLLGTQGPFESISEPNPIIQSTRQKNCWKRLSKKDVGDQLLMLAAQDSPITITKAAEIIGVSRRYLHINFNGITTGMVEKWREHQRTDAKERLEAACRIYRECAIKIAKEGRSPTRRLVGLDIADTSVLKIRKRKIVGICNRICKEVGDSYRGK